MMTFWKKLGGRLTRLPQSEPGCWIYVEAPTEEELRLLVYGYGVAESFIPDCLDEEESSHVDHEPGQTLVIVDLPVSQPGREEGQTSYQTMPVGVILQERYFITVTMHPHPVFEEFFTGSVRECDPQLKTQMLLHLWLRVTNHYIAALKDLGRRFTRIETELHRSLRNRELMELLEVEKSLVYFSTSLKADELTLRRISTGRQIKLYEADQDLLDDVLIETDQAVELCSIYTGLLSRTMEAFGSVISNNLNQVMKVLTSLTLVMAIPAVVSGIFGMNVGLPTDNFWIAMGVMLALVLIACIILTKKKML